MRRVIHVTALLLAPLAALHAADTPKPVATPLEEAVILTPRPGPAPRINGEEKGSGVLNRVWGWRRFSRPAAGT